MCPFITPMLPRSLILLYEFSVNWHIMCTVSTSGVIIYQWMNVMKVNMIFYFQGKTNIKVMKDNQKAIHPRSRKAKQISKKFCR